MGRKKLNTQDKGKQVYIYPKEIYVTTLGLDKTVSIAVSAIKTAYEEDLETNAAAKKLQDDNLESNYKQQLKK